jgi:hypothetical protein
MKRRTVFKGVTCCAVVILVGVAWGSVGWYERARLTPPHNATTLRDFAECMSSPTRLVKIQDEDATLIVWIGDTARTLPSGPSCYVFNSGGQLIDWAPETGDGQRVTKYLEQAWHAEPLTVQQVIESLGPTHKS